MADQKGPQMQATLGLTGLTSNAMALIAPAPFYGSPSQSRPTRESRTSHQPHRPCGSASSPLSCSVWPPPSPTLKSPSSIPAPAPVTTTRNRPCSPRTRPSGMRAWPSSSSAGLTPLLLVYPGVMVATTGIFCGYIVGFLYPNVMSGSNPGPVFMSLVAIVFSFFVAWIASKGAGASTAVNLAINVIQISALVVFSVLALGYRSSHPAGSAAFQYDSQTLATYTYQFATPRTDPRCATPAARHCRCWIQRESRFPTRSTTQKEIPAATSWPILPRRRWWCLTS